MWYSIGRQCNRTRIMKLFFRVSFIVFVTMVIAAASFGVRFGMGGVGVDGASTCPFTDETMSLCPMNAVSHIASWKHFFAALPATELVIAAALFFIAFIFVAPHSGGERTGVLAARRHYYRKKRKVDKLYNYVGTLFSSGILHPKIYA